MFDWKSGLTFLTAMLAALLLCGCAQKPEPMALKLGKVGDPNLSNVARMNLQAMGGRDLFDMPLIIKSEAIVSIFGRDNSRALIKQSQEIDVQARKITLISRDASVKIAEHMTIGIPATVAQERETGRVNIADSESVYGSTVKLTLAYYAMTGIFGLLDDTVTLRYLGEERKGGKVYHKIQADGFFVKQRAKKELGIPDSLTIWFDADDWLVDRILLRYLDPMGSVGYKYLAVNVGNHARLDNGLVLPKYLAYVPGDEHENYSENYILTVEFQESVIERWSPDQRGLESVRQGG